MKKFSTVFTRFGGLALASALVTGFLTGCSSSTSSTTTTTTTSQTTTSYAQYLFNVNYGSPSVTSFIQHNDSGALTATQTPTIAAGNGATSIVNNPAGQFAYVNNSVDSTISEYAISPSLGTLSLLGTAPSGGTGTPIGGVMNPNGLYYYTANAGDISAFSLSTTGALTLLSNTAATAVGEPQQMAFDSTGTYLYVSGATGLYVFTVSGGTLTPVSANPTVSTGVAMGGLTIDNASHLYATAGTNQILGWTIGGSGVLTAIAPASLPTLPTGAFNGTPAGLAFEPNHAALYIAEPGIGGIGAYAVTASSGLLTQANGSPYAAASNVYSVATDPTGSYLYSANYSQNTIGAYVIGTGGALGLVTQQPFSTGSEPIALKLIQYVTYVQQ